jgi:mannose/fructose/N-acetylgalactosamine-specific phosphotransferase system component IIC
MLPLSSVLALVKSLVQKLIGGHCRLSEGMDEHFAVAQVLLIAGDFETGNLIGAKFLLVVAGFGDDGRALRFLREASLTA